MTIQISVVVPVYNPGDAIEACIESYLAQTLPRDEREIIFVDDGSTDRTPELLDRLAEQHDDVRVFHEPNSGWSGRPRNIGIDAARGEYVFFCDHDDWLGPEGLERMVAAARRTGADVLVPKMVGHDRGVPGALFRQNLDAATLGVDPLMSSLTPHKLFRRSFLDEYAIRFPEGKRRLEDHLFVTTAYLRARVITVMSDYPTYHHGWRDDRSNAVRQGWDPPSYFRFLREVLDEIDANTTPGAFRDELMSRAYGTEMMRRLRDRKFLRWDRTVRKQVLHEVRTLAIERYPVDYSDRLAIVPRAHARAVMANRLGPLERLAEAERSVAAQVRLAAIGWNGNGWTASVEAELVFADGSPVVVEPSRGGWALDRRLLPQDLDPEPHEQDDLLRTGLDVLVVDRTSDVQWYVPGRTTPSLVPVDGSVTGAHRVVLRADADVDPSTLAGGRPLEPGDWALKVAVSIFGIRRAARVDVGAGQSVRLPAPGLFPVCRTVVVPRSTPKACRLSFRVNPETKSSTASIVKRATALEVTGDGELTARFAITIAADAPEWPCTLTLEDQPRSAEDIDVHPATEVRLAGTIQRSADGTQISWPLKSARPLPTGLIRVKLQVDDVDKPVPLGTLHIGPDGASTRAELRPPRAKTARVPDSRPKPAPLVVRVRRFRRRIVSRLRRLRTRL